MHGEINLDAILTAPALVEPIQAAMVEHLDASEAVIDPTKGTQRAAYLQGATALHAATIQAMATAEAAATIAAALDRLSAAIKTACRE